MGRRDREEEQADPTAMVGQLRISRDILAVVVPPRNKESQPYMRLPSPEPLCREEGFL